MRKIREFLINHWVRFLISFFIGVFTMVIYLAVKNGWQYSINYVNATFMSAAILIGIAALSTLTLFGAFDIFSYFFNRKKKEDGKKEILSEYAERKRIERGKQKLIFIPYLFNGIIFLVASLILRFTVLY